jgi:hypothetical protein
MGILAHGTFEDKAKESEYFPFFFYYYRPPSSNPYAKDRKQEADE